MPLRMVAVLLVAGSALAACTSPEATRARGSGPGGDVGNRGSVVRMHDGAEPYWSTPRIEARIGRPADRPSRR
jgi:hypothetical protein